MDSVIYSESLQVLRVLEAYILSTVLKVLSEYIGLISLLV
jgi:hypothetical protein